MFDRRPMRVRAPALFLFALCALAAPVAHAGVPRACVYMTFDPILCKQAYAEERLDVLPSARVRVLERQRRSHRRVVVPVQDAERNALLEQIRDAAREAPAAR